MPANPRPAHEAWWSSFWSRSFVAVNASHWGGIDSEVTPALPRAAAVVEVPSAPRPVASPPVAGAALWLRASSLAGQANGSAVNSWKDESPAGFPVSQANAALQPHFVSDAFGPGAGGVRFDGISSFLSNSESTLPTEESTMFVVLKDGGSTGNGCCSGALFFSGGFVGVSTSSPQTGGVFSDDLPESGAPVVAMIDFPGSNVRRGEGSFLLISCSTSRLPSQTRGNENIRGSPIIATAVYGPANGTLRIDGCYSASTSSAVGAPSKGVMVGTRNNELERYFLGDIGEIIVYPRVLSADEIAETEAYLAAAWPAVDLKTNATCRQPPDGGITISAMYAVTRYTQAVQSRGVS